MGIIYKIQRDNKKLEELLKWLQDNKGDIKDILFGVRFCNGNMELWADEVPLETMCTISKMLDIRIDEAIIGENLEVGTDDDDLEDELD